MTDLEVKSMIAACRGFYRAITELDQVAAPHGSDLQREAYTTCGRLQKTLDAAIREWSDWSTDPAENGPKLRECAANGSGKLPEWSTVKTREDCDIYTVENESGLGPDCLAAKTKYEAVPR